MKLLIEYRDEYHVDLLLDAALAHIDFVAEELKAKGFSRVNVTLESTEADVIASDNREVFGYDVTICAWRGTESE